MRNSKRALAEADAHPHEAANYIFLAEQVLVVASHMPPAFLQSASSEGKH